MSAAPPVVACREESALPTESTEEPPPEICRRSDTLNRDLSASIGDGAGYGIMVGMGETYLAAFVLAIGLGEVMSGLITSVPILAGGLMQMISPRAVRFIGSYRRWVAICVLTQAASFLPLIAAAVYGKMPAWAAIAVVSIYWGSGMGAGPAWNTWIGTLVPRRLRPKYFARRTRVSQLAVFAGFIAAGLSLQAATPSGMVLPAFAGVFACAAACRFLSGWFLARQSEPRFVPIAPRKDSLLAEFRKLIHGREGKLLRYIIVMQCAVQISGPYFSPYMFKQLKMSYGEFVALISTSFLAKVAFLPMCGRFAQRFGPRKLLYIGGTGLIPLSALWLVSNSLPWLIFVQLLAGAAWAAYELAFFLMFFDSIPEEERTGVLTLYNFANAAALVVGSLIGGLVLKWFGTTPTAYGVLFALSGLGRGLTLPLLRRVPDAAGFEVPAPMGIRTDAVRPQSGTIDRPILASLNVGAGKSNETVEPATPLPAPASHRIDPPRREVPEPESKKVATVITESVA